MALTSSGEINMSEIRTELGASGQITLKEASDGTVATINTANASGDRPDGAAPHAMSEFYSYDHSLVSTSWGTPSDTTANFSGTVGDTDIHGVITVALTGGSGDITASYSVNSGTVRGTMRASVSSSGDPGTGGTSNSAGGYQVIGTSAGSLNLSVSGDVTLYIRFKYTSHAVLTENTLRTFTITNNSVSTTAITSSCLYTSGGGGGGR